MAATHDAEKADFICQAANNFNPFLMQL